MLRTAAENGSGGKTDIPPDKWFEGKPAEYLELHSIPKDPTLWKLERFEDFITERKKLIREKFSNVLVAAAAPQPPSA